MVAGRGRELMCLVRPVFVQPLRQRSARRNAIVGVSGVSATHDGGGARTRLVPDVCGSDVTGRDGFVFFKQKTAYEIRPRDWSSDVCSSDLGPEVAEAQDAALEDRELVRR